MSRNFEYGAARIRFRLKTMLAVVCGLSILHLLLNIYGIYYYMVATPSGPSDYPLNIDLINTVEQDLLGLPHPAVFPINNFHLQQLTISPLQCDHTAVNKILVILLVKSRFNNYKLRNIIRQTWGKQRTFHISIKINQHLYTQVHSRTVFTVGKNPEGGSAHDLHLESSAHGDIIQGDFIDTYRNLTLKTMTSFYWLLTHCAVASFAIFVDDDCFIHTPNVLRVVAAHAQESISRDYVFGCVRDCVLPFRPTFDKWYVSFDDYPYMYYPPFATGAFMLMPLTTVTKLYHATKYTKMLWMDDVYLGIVGYKLGIPFVNDRRVYYYKIPYNDTTFRNILLVHGYKDPDEMNVIWSRITDLEKKFSSYPPS